MTVVELMITMTILMVVMGAVLGILDSLTKNERFQQAKVANQEQVRLTMTEMAKDIRAANPLHGGSSSAEYANRIEMANHYVPGSYVRWRLDGSALKREISSTPGGSVSSSETVMKNVRNIDRGVPLFRYYDHKEKELATSGATPALAGDIRNCTIRVRISLVADPELGPSAFTEESDAQLRNNLPGGTGC